MVVEPFDIQAEHRACVEGLGRAYRGRLLQRLTLASASHRRESPGSRVHQLDCDLYSSTLEGLNFCTPLVKTGTIIFFDDWYLSDGDLSLGEGQACKEWLANNPHITLIDFGDVSIMGKMFLVNVTTSPTP